MTPQEMINKAWRGLKAQEFRKSVAPGFNGERCVYLAKNGDRCAWGHCDPNLTNEKGDIWSLHKSQIGIAASLTNYQLRFALSLQTAHDASSCPQDMERELRLLAAQQNLTIPED